MPRPHPALHVALLRGINVGGHNRIPMPELRELCGEIGWSDAQTYIQSGNLVFRASGTRAELERALGDAIGRRFDLAIPVVVRSALEWPAYVGGNPFAEASEREPNLVMLALSSASPAPDAAARLAERAVDGERVERVGDALWIHFAGGAARSRLSPPLLDRCVGSPVTTRNWRTVLALDGIMAAATGAAGR